MATHVGQEFEAADTDGGGVSRRDMLKGLGVGAVAAGLGLGPNVQLVAAQSSDVMDKVSAFYRLKVGDLEVTVINDGYLPFTAAMLSVNAPEDERTTLLEQYHLPTDLAPLTMSTLLIRSSDRLVLVDTGRRLTAEGDALSGLLGDESGKLLATLDALGIHREDITDVLFSHYHPDHVGGASLDGEISFPNAQHYIAQVEWDFMQSDSIPEELAPIAAYARDKLQPIIANDGQLAFFGDEEEVIPGIQAWFTPGHSTGHHALLIASNGQQLMYTGDTVYHSVFSVQKPDWYGFADELEDEVKAVETRHRMLERVADEQIPVVVFHFPFPGIGTITRDGSAFRYTPTG